MCCIGLQAVKQLRWPQFKFYLVLEDGFYQSFIESLVLSFLFCSRYKLLQPTKNATPCDLTLYLLLWMCTVAWGIFCEYLRVCCFFIILYKTFIIIHHIDEMCILFSCVYLFFVYTFPQCLLNSLPTYKCRRLRQQESKEREAGRHENFLGNEQSNWEKDSGNQARCSKRDNANARGREKDQAADVEVQWSNTDVSYPLFEGVNNANLLAQLFSEQRFPRCHILYWWWEIRVKKNWHAFLVSI